MSAPPELLDRADELLAEIRRGWVSEHNRPGLAVLVESARSARAARRLGIADARRQRRAAIEAAIERHVWKTPLSAPDFVEQVLQHFAQSGTPAPSHGAIRRWRDARLAQISIVQHKAAKGA